MAGPGIFPELLSILSKNVFLVDFVKLTIPEDDILEMVLYSPGPGIELRRFWLNILIKISFFTVESVVIIVQPGDIIQLM